MSVSAFRSENPMKKLRQLLTPGHAIALVTGVAGVYFAWDRVFTPGGTGSNVVLGLLLALAAIWVSITNLGPAVDDLLSPPAQREARQKLRQSRALLDELQNFGLHPLLITDKMDALGKVITDTPKGGAR